MARCFRVSGKALGLDLATNMADDMERVLFLTGAFPNMPCGVGDYTSSLTQELVKLGLEVHVLTSHDRRVVTTFHESGGVFVHPKILSWGFTSVPLIMREVRRISPDLIHIQYPASFGAKNRRPLANLLGIVTKAATNGKARIVTTLHEYVERSLRWRLRALLNALTSDCVVCVSSYDRIALAKLISKPLVHIPIASSIPVVSVTPDQRQKLRDSLGIAQSCWMIVYFGFVTPLKGFDVLIKAFAELKRRAWPGKLVVLTGLDPDKDRYHREMVTLLNSFGLGDDCIYQKPYFTREEVSTHLQSADMAILPFTEGASERRGSLLTAIGNGLPVITTVGPHLPPTFKHGDNIYLVPSQDPKAIVRAVIELSHNSALRLSMSQRAMSLSEAYSWESIAEKTVQTYWNVLQCG